MTSKNCTKCGELKPLFEFYPQKKSKDGLRHWCKSCEKLSTIEYFHTKEGLVVKIFGSQKRRSRKRNDNLPSYTKKELSVWMFDQKQFNDIYSDWVASGYNVEKTPSCDRLDDYKPYSLDNIRLVTWKENNTKGKLDRVNGINNKTSKAIIQLTKNDEIVAEYYSGGQAERTTSIFCSSIFACCHGQRKTAGGFKWKFA